MVSINKLTECRSRGKWSALVVYLLRENPQRYHELKHEISGISQKMLTQTLRHLEADGLVVRTVYPTMPPSVEYALTPLGKNLLEPFLGMIDEAALQENLGNRD